MLLNNYDIVICGAGLAGLTLALQLKKRLPASSILILERQSGPLPAGTHKVGESTTEGGTYLLRELAGLKEYVESTHIKKLGLRFFGSGHRQDGFAKRFEIGDTLFARNTSYQVDRGILENDLRTFCREAGVTIAEGVTVKDVSFAEDLHTVSFTDANTETVASVQCRWVVDASGRRRFLQTKLGKKKALTHNASSSWWRLQGDFDVAKMVDTQETAWHDRVVPRRWYSTNHLFGPGYFIWIIPLCSNMTSIGIVADEDMHPVRERHTMEKSLAWLAKYEPDLYHFIKDEKPLDFRMMKNFAYTTTQAFSSERWTCIGEAAAFTDPLYSMGTDLIAVGNRITTRMIELEQAGQLSEDTVALYNQLYLKVVDVAALLFTHMYPTFDTDDVVILKIMWDIGCYWGFFSQLTIQDFLYQPELLPRLLALANRLEVINAQVQTALRSAADGSLESAMKSGFYNFGGVTDITKLRATVTERKTLEEVEHNMAFLEQFAATLCEFIARTRAKATPDTQQPSSSQPNHLLDKLDTYLTPVKQVSLMPARVQA